jgi:hypothetical protein
MDGWLDMKIEKKRENKKKKKVVNFKLEVL